MAIARTYSRALTGIEARLVEVEAHLAGGLPAFSIVGLPEAAVRESKDRVRAAIQNSGFTFPNRRITVNLAPAEFPKTGGRFDLPIALSLLAAMGELPQECTLSIECFGELALDGGLRPVHGIFASALAAAHDGRDILCPEENAQEATLSKLEHQVFAAPSLFSALAHLRDDKPLSPFVHTTTKQEAKALPDLKEVKGQDGAKRALEVAAAGRHHLLMVGPPGSGKTLLSHCLPSILPNPTPTESCHIAQVHSIGNQEFNTSDWGKRPFRAPHHSASVAALVGGGTPPKAGEITLAHLGILFLDEFPEFPRPALEALREPLENGHIQISRAASRATFPAQFQLIAAMNPCPCGYYGDHEQACRCTPRQIAQYRNRISGPILDRIDMQIEVPRQSASILASTNQGPSSKEVRTKVAQAHNRQIKRQGKSNHFLTAQDITCYCALDPTSQALLDRAVEKLKLSARAYHRILKMARTIADLENCETISTAHLSEAIQYRRALPDA